MIIVYAILFSILNFGLLLLNLVGLPANWLIVITTAVVMWLQRANPAPMFSTTTLIIIAVLAALGEVAEFAAGAAGARQAGASRQASAGALIGGMVGAIAGTFAIPIPVIGSILGACAGAFIAALYVEFSGGQGLSQAARVGWGAGKGRLMGTLIKLAIGGAIWGFVSIAAFWP